MSDKPKSDTDPNFAADRISEIGIPLAPAKPDDSRVPGAREMGTILTSDGGIVFVWQAGSAEVSLAMPKDRSITYYAAHKPGEARAGVLTEWAALEVMLDWMDKDGPFPTSGIVEGAAR